LGAANLCRGSHIFVAPIRKWRIQEELRVDHFYCRLKCHAGDGDAFRRVPGSRQNFQVEHTRAWLLAVYTLMSWVVITKVLMLPRHRDRITAVNLWTLTVWYIICPGGGVGTRCCTDAMYLKLWNTHSVLMTPCHCDMSTAVNLRERFAASRSCLHYYWRIVSFPQQQIRWNALQTGFH